ncbi:MAG: hypothetical protein ACK5NA_09690 [Enterococcus sp.]
MNKKQIGKYVKRASFCFGIALFLYSIYHHYTIVTGRFASMQELIVELIIWAIIGVTGFSLLHRGVTPEVDEEARQKKIDEQRLAFYEERNQALKTEDIWESRQRNYRGTEQSFLGPEAFNSLGIDFEHGLLLLSREDYAQSPYVVKIPVHTVTDVYLIERQAVTYQSANLMAISVWGGGRAHQGFEETSLQLAIHTTNKTYPILMMTLTAVSPEVHSERMAQLLEELSADFSLLGITFHKKSN